MRVPAGMSAAAHWARLDGVRRWRTLLVLALLVALCTGTVLGSVAAARRGSTALDRLAARTLPATVAVLSFTPGFDWSPVRALPEVEALTTDVDNDFRLEGSRRRTSSSATGRMPGMVAMA